MECQSPILIKNPSPGTFNSYMYIRVPCGKCEACQTNKALAQYARLKYEYDHCASCFFVTMTYNDYFVPVDGVDRYEVRMFLKQFRRALKVPIKYFLSSEYGPNETHRPHYHFILWCYESVNMEHCRNLLEHYWKKGFITISKTTPGRLKYLSGYFISKLFVPPEQNPVFSLSSKGLGIGYVSDMIKWHTDDISRHYVDLYGHHYPMHRYYKDKIYSPAENQRYSFACADRAQKMYDKDIAEHGAEWKFKHDHEVRVEFARKVRSQHKKKCQL